MPTCLVILAEAFEELEAVAPVDLLRRAGVSVTLASLAQVPLVTGRCHLTLRPDTHLDAIMSQEFDLLLLPGGPGVRHLRSDSRVLELVRRQNERQALIAAICAAPTVLADLGLLAGRRYTAHPSVAKELPHTLPDEQVVRDGNLITSRGAGTAIAFGLALVGVLCGEQVARKIAAEVAA
jgi:4-methyl-5(b-hydroxyethyl)-thiazole monophosphate biosynthesis